MSKNKVKVKDTLENFLFNQIQNDPEFIEQEDAIKSFIFLFEKDKAQAKHLLFNMATGTGKPRNVLSMYYRAERRTHPRA